MDETAAKQLDAIADVHRSLAARSIDYWLFGGWAVDFHVGSVTRTHQDVDVAVWFFDLATIRAILEAEGWRHAPEEGEDGGTGYERGGVRMELTFLTRDDSSEIFIPMRSGPLPWTRELFGDDERELRGVTARVVALGPLTEGKAWVRGDEEDVAKDRADHALLMRLRAR